MTKPPNLRTAEGDRRCSNCGYFFPAKTWAGGRTGKCEMFEGYPVMSYLTCDDHAYGKPGTRKAKKTA